MSDDDNIEANIMAYVQSTLRMGDFPNRDEAIRRVTGELPVFPSAVAKVVKRMLDAGKLTMRADGQLNIKR
jgi:hypothetical protein